MERGKAVWGRGEVRLIVCSEDTCEGESRDSTEVVDNASWLWAIVFIVLTGFTYHEGLYCFAFFLKLSIPQLADDRK